MNAVGKFNGIALGGIVFLTLASTGCLATRKYVQTQAVAPMQANIKTVDQKVDTKTQELDQRISDVDHRAEQGYSEASSKAEAAGQSAQKANDAAQGAQQTANQGVTMATLNKRDIDNIDTYKPVKTENVLFDFNRYNLNPDNQQQLDSFAQSLDSMKHYAVEVKGFTDSRGSKEYNLELSQRRADTVVRYLTENDHVPLIKIHVLGLGEADPAGDNKTSDGRKQNRRVEVRIVAPDLGGANQAAMPSSSQSTTNALPAGQSR